MKGIQFQTLQVTAREAICPPAHKQGARRAMLREWHSTTHQGPGAELEHVKPLRPP